MIIRNVYWLAGGKNFHKEVVPLAWILKDLSILIKTTNRYYVLLDKIYQSDIKWELDLLEKYVAEDPNSVAEI